MPFRLAQKRPRPGSDPPRDALARPDAARLRADVPVRERAGGVRGPLADKQTGAELGRGLGCRDPGPVAC
jgi:hypothetical protein